MRLTGNNPRKARGPLCLEYSPDLRSVAFFRHKWTRRIENYNLLRCFGGKKKAPTNQNSTILEFMNYDEEK